MGYSHYWEIKKLSTSKQWKNIIDNLNNIYSKLEGTEIDGDIFKLTSSYPESSKNIIPKPLKPCFGDFINFNGCPNVWTKEISKDNNIEEYESVLLNINEYQCDSFYIDEKVPRSINDYCKTNRNPYDFFVCVSLLIIKYFMKDNIKIDSDGDIKDWKIAIEYFNKYFRPYGTNVDIIKNSHLIINEGKEHEFKVRINYTKIKE